MFRRHDFLHRLAMYGAVNTFRDAVASVAEDT